MNEAELRQRVAEVVGGEVVRFERAAGGQSRETWEVDVDEGGAVTPLVLRQDTGGGPMSGTELTLEREASVYAALSSSPVLVPRVHAMVSEDAVLLDRMPGTPDWAALTGKPDEQQAVGAHFMELLAELHTLDPATLDLPWFARPDTPEGHALLEVDLWERLFRRHVAQPDPFVAYALDWLRRHAPTTVGRTSLVHGDCGVGNFLFEDGRVTAILDWEFAHFGDPVDDLAWIVQRDLLQGGDLSGHVAAWRERVGIAVERQTLLYYLALVNLRCRIACSIALGKQNQSMDRGVYLTVTNVFVRTMLRAICEHDGVDIEPATLPEPSAPSPRAPLYGSLLDDLLGVLFPEITNPSASRRVQAMAAILIHLQTSDVLQPAMTEFELDDMASVLGERPPTLEEGRAAIDKAAAAGAGVLPYLVRSNQRELALWGPVVAPLLARQADVDRYL